WLGRHYGVGTYFALMATTASLGILFVYALVAIGGMVFFWNARHQKGQSYNIILDVVLPLISVVICGFAIYSTLLPPPPAPTSSSAWIALAWLVAGMLVMCVLVLTRRNRVRAFGEEFESSES